MIGIGDVFVNVVPNMEAFVAEVDAGVTAAAASAEAEVAGATAAGTEAGVATGAESASKDKGIMSKFKGMAALVGGFFAYELIKKSVAAFDTYQQGIVALKSTLTRMKLGKELPDLTAWTKSFSESSGVAQDQLLILEKQLTTAGLVGSKKVEDMTNAVMGLSQETNKSVSMFTRSLIPSILNTPAAAITQMEKWKIISMDAGKQIKALTASSQSALDTMVKNGDVTQAYADKVSKMSSAQREAAATQMEMNALLVKGKNAYKTTPLEKFKNDIHNIEITVGQKLMPVLDKVFGYIAKHIPQIEHAIGTIWKDLQPALLVFIHVFEQVAKVIGDVVGWFLKGSRPARTIAASIAAIALAIFIVIKAMEAWAAVMKVVGAVMDAELLTNPVFLIIGALILLAVAVVMNWSKVKKFLLTAWTDLKRWWSDVWDAIHRVAHTVWDAIVRIVKDAFKVIAAVVLIAMSPIIISLWLAYKAAKMVWDAIGSYVIDALKIIWDAVKLYIEYIELFWKGLVFVVKVTWRAITAVVKTAWKAIIFEVKLAWKVITAIWGAASAFFGTIFKAIWVVAKPIWHAIQSLVGDVWKGIKDVWSPAVRFFSAIWDGIVSVVKDALNGIIAIWDDTIGKIAHGQKISAGPLHVTMPDLNIPKLAMGGIVTRPTLILAGEAGPEMITPLGSNRGGGILPLPHGKQKVRLVVDGAEFSAYIEEVNANAQRRIA